MEDFCSFRIADVTELFSPRFFSPFFAAITVSNFAYPLVDLPEGKHVEFTQFAAVFFVFFTPAHLPSPSALVTVCKCIALLVCLPFRSPNITLASWCTTYVFRAAFQLIILLISPAPPCPLFAHRFSIKDLLPRILAGIAIRRLRRLS